MTEETETKESLPPTADEIIAKIKAFRAAKTEGGCACSGCTCGKRGLAEPV